MNNIDYWFTTETGKHIPVMINETPKEAVERTFQNKVQSNVLKNRESLTSYVKEQVNVDLNKAATEKQSHPRSYLNIDSRKLTENEMYNLRKALQSYGHNINIESNGVYDYAITYERDLK